jgi:competence protein ComGC
MKLLTSISILLLVLFSSCKKDKEVTIQGNWNGQSMVSKYYVNNVLDNTETESLAGLTVNFKSDGTVVSTQGGTSNTTNYSHSGNTLTLDGEVWTVQVLNETNLTLYMKTTMSPGEYDETTLSFTR